MKTWKAQKSHQTKDDFLCLLFRFTLPIISGIRNSETQRLPTSTMHYFPLSCQDGRQHKNKHEKYLFSMFLYSVSGFLVQNSLKQTTVEKCLPCGFSLSPSCNWGLMRDPTSSEVLVNMCKTDLWALTFPLLT